MQIDQYEQNLMESERKIASLEKNKRDLTLRLSKFAGTNLTYKNLTIADLSDENRPTKLAEDFSELYDNGWTDAFEALTNKDEREKTMFMLSILKKSIKLITKSLPDNRQTEESLQTYIQKCLQLCWSMCRHEPPFYIYFIDTRSDTPFDTNLYKPYTKTGKYVDYVVWPALYLHEGVQCCQKVLLKDASRADGSRALDVVRQDLLFK